MTTHRLTLLRALGWSVRDALARCYRSGGARMTIYAPTVVDPEVFCG